MRIGYHLGMVNSVLRWVLAGVALLIVGPLLSVLTDFVPAPDGSGTITPLLSSSVFIGLIVWVLACAIAGGFGVFTASLTTWRLGVASTGFCLIWSAWGTPRLDDLIRTPGFENPSVAMAIDGAVLAIVACACAWIVMSRARAEQPDESQTPVGIATGVGACALAAMVAAWLIARDERVGQTIGAAAVAGLAGGAAGRAVAPQLPMRWLLLGLPLAALVSPIIGGMMTKGALDLATLDGTVSPLLRVMPADWIAGALIGFPVGSAQAESIIDKQHQTNAPAGAPAS